MSSYLASYCVVFGLMLLLPASPRELADGRGEGEGGRRWTDGGNVQGGKWGRLILSIVRDVVTGDIGHIAKWGSYCRQAGAVRRWDASTAGLLPRSRSVPSRL